MSSKYGQILKIAWNIVKKVGTLAANRNAQGRPKYTAKSSEVDVVTPSDSEIEEIIIAKLSEQFPDHKFIGEERAVKDGNEKLSNAPTWFIDPIDGTMNYVHNFPHYCVSLGLVVDKVPVLGIIYNPALRQKFTATEGTGAFYNDCHICVSGEKRLDKAILCSEYGIRPNFDKGKIVHTNFWNLATKAHGIRSLGSAALDITMVAMGGADATWLMGLHHWDVAAGIVLVKEAGGVIVDPAGGPYDFMSRRILVASSMELACAVAENLTQIYPEPLDV